MSFWSRLRAFFGLEKKEETLPFSQKRDLRPSSEIAQDEVRTLLQKGDYKQAGAIISAEQRRNPLDPETRFLHAHWLHLQHCFSESETELRKLLEKEEQERYLIELAQVIFAEEKFSETESLCQKILSQNPQQETTLLLLAQLYLTLIQDKQEQKPAAISLKDAYQNNISWFDKLNQVTSSLEDLPEQNQKVVETRAEIYATLENQDKLQNLLQSHPSPFIEGKIKFIQGDFSEAEHIFQKLVSENETDAQNLISLALAHEKNSHLREAFLLFQKALLMRPQDLRARRHLKHLALELQDQDLLSGLEQEVEKHPENAGLFSLYARILEERGNYQKALSYYARAASLPNASLQTIRRYARLLAQSQSDKSALQILANLSKKYPEDQTLLDLYLAQTQKSNKKK